MPSLWSLVEDGRRHSHPLARLDARGLPGGIPAFARTFCRAPLE
jgi:hypothetical protein